MNSKIFSYRLAPTTKSTRWYESFVDVELGCLLGILFYLIYQPIKALFGKKKPVPKLTVSPEAIIVEGTTYPLHELEDLRVHHYTESFREQYDAPHKVTHIAFVHGFSRYRYQIVATKVGLRRLLDEWYKQRRPFKEFLNDSRTFKFRRKSYAEIQEIKRKYGVEW